MADDRLAHSWRAGERLDLAFLEDYANLSAAALALFEHTAERRLSDAGASAGCECLDADYLDAGQGGYFQISARRVRRSGAGQERAGRADAGRQRHAARGARPALHC